MMLRDQIICMDEVKEIYVPQIKILPLKSWYLQETLTDPLDRYSNLLLNAYINHHVHAEHPQQLNSIVTLAYSVFFYVHAVLTPTKMEIPTTSALCA